MTLRGAGPVGVLLAGGRGRRMGGDKAGVSLAGRPLAHWALDPLTDVVEEVVVACRLDTKLPALPGVREAWVERQAARGALAGIVSALGEARGRAIVTVSPTLPLLDADVIRALLRTPSGGRSAVVAGVGDRLEPLAARWEPEALALLSALRTGPAWPSLDEAVAALAPAVAAFPAGDPRFFRVTRPEDLLHAAAILDQRKRSQALA